jgi:hypothetical protein|tara:strand:+ start:33 stop:641 length:609 start_codon:yes stop_codon:yes gene_type:complete
MENFISKELCEDIIQRFENDPKKVQSAIKDTNKVVLDLERRNSFHLNVKDMNNSSHIEDNLKCKLKDAINIYKREFCNYFKRYNENPKFINKVIFSERDIKITDVLIQRVTPKSQFRWHTDENTDSCHTCIIYLNDIDVDDGGATEFVCGRKVQPKAGKLLLFPAVWSNVHRGSFVHKPKYMITAYTDFSPKTTPFPFHVSY